MTRTMPCYAALSLLVAACASTTPPAAPTRAPTPSTATEPATTTEQPAPQPGDNTINELRGSMIVPVWPDGTVGKGVDPHVVVREVFDVYSQMTANVGPDKKFQRAQLYLTLLRTDGVSMETMDSVRALFDGTPVHALAPEQRFDVPRPTSTAASPGSAPPLPALPWAGQPAAPDAGVLWFVLRSDGYWESDILVFQRNDGVNELIAVDNEFLARSVRQTRDRFRQPLIVLLMRTSDAPVEQFKALASELAQPNIMPLPIPEAIHSSEVKGHPATEVHMAP